MFRFYRSLSVIIPVSLMIVIFASCGGSGGDSGGNTTFTPTVYSTTSTSNRYPVTDGQWVAWTGFDKKRVWHFDGADLTDLTPLVEGDDVLLQDLYFDGTYVVITVFHRDIYKYYYVDSSAPAPQAVLFQQGPDNIGSSAFKGGIFVWEYSDGGDRTIYYIDLNRSSPAVVQVTNNTQRDWEPHIDGSVIIWKRYTSYFGAHTLYSYDINAPGVTLFAAGNIDKDTEVMFEDGVAVWSAVDSGDTEIYYVDLNTGPAVIQLTSNSLRDDYPTTADRYIAWGNSNGTIMTFYYADLRNTPPVPVQIHQNLNTPYFTRIMTDAGRFTWRSHDGNDFEIFVYNVHDAAPTARQVTDDLFFEQLIDIEGNNVFYSLSDGTDDEVILADTTFPTISTTLMTNNVVMDKGRAIDVGNVIWTEHRTNASGGPAKLFFHSIGSGATTVLTAADDRSVLDVRTGNGDVAWLTRGAETKIYARQVGSSSAPVGISTPTGDFIYEPKMDGGIIVWSSDDGNDWEIYSCDLNAPVLSVRTITDNSIHDQAPVIDNGVIVWGGYDGNDTELFYYDLKVPSPTIVQITNDSVDQTGPFSIDSGVIVWRVNDGNDYEVYYHDLTAAVPATMRLTDNSYSDDGVVTHNRVIAWNASAPSGDEIYHYDLNASVPAVVRVTTDTIEANSPDIDNGIIVMLGNDGSDDEIYYYDMNAVTPTLVQVSDNDWDDQYPFVDDGLIVWECDGQICYFDLNTASPIEMTATNSNYGNYDYSTGSGALVWRDEFVWAMRP